MSTSPLKDLISRGFSLVPLHNPTPEGCSCGKNPCAAVGKHPRTRSGVHNKSNKWIDIVEWKQLYPEANWAVASATPLPEGGYMAVLDVDPRNNGDHTLAELEEKHGELPKTLWANTGGGGYHYVFKTREPVASAILGPGLELKGVGSYIVVAPSKHVSGRTYSWGVDITTPIVDLPSWVPVTAPDGAERPEHNGEDPASTFLGRVAEKMGWLGESIGNGKRAVMCPWQHEHSNAAWHPRSTGTVLLPATPSSNFGGFRCMHEHCAKRTAGDVLNAASEEAREYARSFHTLAVAQGTTQSGAVRLGQKELQGNWAGDRFIPHAITANAAAIFSKDPDWEGVIAYDEMLATVVALKAPPFPTPWGTQYPRTWQESDDRHALVWLQTGEYAARWTAKTVLEAVHTTADSRRFNRLTEELDNLVWDGVSRLDSWLVDYMGAENTDYVRTIGVKWMLSAVARAKQPGCKVDHVLVLEGAQGLGKSRALRILGGQWFSDDLGDISHGKDASERIRGKWIIEDSELTALRRTEVGAAKAFVTRQVDYFREAYAKRATEYPRRCVFAGTVNNPVYLKDSTGARRFWCAHIKGPIDFDALMRDRDQLWAEAVYRYTIGEPWWADSVAFNAAAQQETETRYVRDPFEDALEFPAGDIGSFVSLYEQLGVPQERRTPEMERRLVDILTRRGYRAKLIGGMKIWKRV